MPSAEKKPTFDSHGYPTEETCEYLHLCSDATLALDFMKAAWFYPDFIGHVLRPAESEVVMADPEDRFLRAATGGWSGNEELIASLRQNFVAWGLTWRLSSCGGLHIFEYPSAASASQPTPGEGSKDG